MYLHNNCEYEKSIDVMNSESANVAIRIRSLTKRYDVVALDGLDLEVKRSEIMCLLGANGAGKTTTLQLLLGFQEPTAGDAWIYSHHVVRERPAARAMVGYLPEVVDLYPWMTGVETLRYFEELAGSEDGSSHGLAALERVGLTARASRARVATYSKGMRQKLGLAVALAKNARVLLLDEPMSGLDPSAANDLVGLLRQLRERGLAILMVTHDIFRAHQVADRIGIMRRGRLVEEVAPAQITAARIEELYVHHLRDVA